MRMFSDDRPERCGGHSATDEINRICGYLGVSGPEDPCSTDEPAELLRMAGLLFREITLSGTWWKDAAGVLLCTDADGVPYSMLPRGTRYEYIERDGTRARVNRDNAERFAPRAYQIYRALPERSLRIKDLRNFILGSFSPRDVICLLLISAAASFLGILIPEITRFMFSTLAPSGDVGDLVSVAVLFAGIVITSELFSLSRIIWIACVGNKVEIAVQNAVWGRLLALPASFFRRFTSGEISHMTEAAGTICDILGDQLIPTVLGACFSVVYLAEMWRLAPPLFVPALVIVALLLAMQLLITLSDYRDSEMTNRHQGAANGLLFQILQGRAKIQIAGAEERAFSRWDSLFSKIPICPKPAVLFVKSLPAAILLGGTIWFYAVAGSLHVTVSDFIASQSAFGLFCAAVMQLTDVTAQIASLRPSAETLRPLLETVPETSSRKARAGTLTGDIRLHDVCFRYEEGGSLILDHLNLQIHPGEYLGIAGTTGCGKSTILRLILGLEQPESGTITFDGIDSAGLDPGSIRRQIGTVLQDGKLFSGDILANITIGAPGISLEEAWEAAEKSGFAEDIRKMPLGMNTVLTENGGGLSGGQQQRLLIARALAQKPRIMILDEATSALDNRTQSRVVGILDSLGITRIVVAHRLSTLQSCTRIIYLDRGKILEEGSFEELMKRNGRFAEQARRQLL